MEYPEGCSTAMRCVTRKVGLYGSEVVSPWGCCFQTGGLVYDKEPLLLFLLLLFLLKLLVSIKLLSALITIL